MIQNLITTPNLTSTSGWIGSSIGPLDKNTQAKASVESVYGRFNDKKEFINAVDELQGSFNAELPR
jgi:hypothetical protein